MAIYNISGTDLNDSAYGLTGSSLAQAYDIDGNEMFVGGTPFVVMAYNVQWFTGINSNQTMQEEILAAYDPDVIGFQEFQEYNQSGIPSMATTLLSSDYPYLEMGNYGNKNAIASKYQLNDFTTIPHTTQTMDGQSYSTATITVDGKSIFLVTAHVTTSDYETTKVEQVHEVYEALQGHDYFILMGDFNTVCKSTSDTEYTTIMKQFVDAGYQIANCSEQHGFIDTWTSGHSSGGTWYPCDHIITSSNIHINLVVADQRKIAVAEQTGQSIDHLAFIAYCTIN